MDATAQLLWGEIFEIFFARAFWQIWQWPSHAPRLRATGCPGVRVLTWRRGARVIARRRATRDARATLSRGETRRSEKLASRDAQRARTRRDRATDARENVNRASRSPETVSGVARVFSARDARRAVRAGCCAAERVDLKSSRRARPRAWDAGRASRDTRRRRVRFGLGRREGSLGRARETRRWRDRAV